MTANRDTRVAPDYPDKAKEMRRLRKQYGWSVNSLAKRYSIDVDQVKAILGEHRNAL